MWDERTATHEALGAACELSPELVLVARPSEQGLLCVAANRAFTERFAPGTEPAGRPVARVLPAPIAAAFAARASTVLSSGEPLDYEDGAADGGPGPLAVAMRNDRAAEAYDEHANPYGAKPATFSDYERVVRCIEQYWFDAAELPRPAG